MMCLVIQFLFAFVLLGAVVSDDGISSSLDASLPTGQTTSLFYLWGIDTVLGGAMVKSQSVKNFACQGQLWSWQAEAIGDMEDYGDETVFGMRKGELFALLALFLWNGQILKECRSIINYCMLLVMPHEVAGMADFTYNKDEGTAYLNAVRKISKCTVFVVTGCRLAILLFLFVYGNQFLAYTQSLSDVLLNSLALAFVLEIDEFFFDVLLSYKKQNALNCLAPIELPSKLKSPFQCLGEVSELVTVSSLVVVTGVMFVAYVAPFSKNYIDKAYADIDCTERL